MPKVKLDIIEGNSGNISFNGWEFNRVAIVSELTSAPAGMLIEATTTSGVPKMNDSHPFIVDAYVVDVQPESINTVGNAVRLNITYRQFTPDVRVTIGSRKIIDETSQHFSNQATQEKDFMKLGYTYPAGHILEGQTDTQGVTLQVPLEFPSFTFSRTEWLSNSADALSGFALDQQLNGNILSERSKKFNTALNSTIWNIKSSDPIKTWQCKMNAASTGNGFDWRVNYTFSFNSLEWTHLGTYNDPTTNQPVPDASLTLPSPDPSAKRFAHYIIQDFNLLGIT